MNFELSTQEINTIQCALSIALETANELQVDEGEYAQAANEVYKKISDGESLI